ncbi:hypothetical protein Dimus_020646 [Dionaea muscipula]
MADERNVVRQSGVDASATHITEATSILTAGDVEDFNDAFPLPVDYQYVLPQPGNTVVDIDLANTVAIHFEALRGGLRLPLHPFIRAILNLHNLLPGHLTPNTYTVIVAYIIRCGLLGMQPSIEVFYWMYQLAPLKDDKTGEESGYYYFNANVKGKKAVKYGVVQTQSNVKNWKVKFVLMTTSHWGVSTRQQEVYLKPIRQMRSYLKTDEMALQDTFISEGKKTFGAMVPSMANILKRVVHILGPPGNVVVAEVLGDGAGSSSSPSELRGVATEPPPTREEGGSSSAPQQRTTPPAPQEQQPLRPSSPRFKIMYGKRGEATPPGSGGEEKSADSAALAPRKRTRAQTKTAAATGGEEVIDFTIGRENEPNVDDAASRVDVTAEGAEGENQYSPYVLEDLTLNQWSMVIDNLEIKRAVGATETAEETAGATATEPPKKKPKRTLKKNGAEVSVATHPGVEPQEKELIVAPAKDKGKGVTDPKRTNLPPQLELPPQLLPIDPATAQPPQKISFSSPRWKIMPHHSIIKPRPDKEAHEALRLEWARGAMTAKDVEVATGLSDEEISQHITASVVKVIISDKVLILTFDYHCMKLTLVLQACTLWTEAVRRRKEQEESLKSITASSSALKEASENAIANALQRAKDAEEKEQKAQSALKLKEKQMAAMEHNFTKSHNDFKHEQARAERAIEELKVRDNTISSMADDAKQMKKKYEVLERKYAALEEAKKKQRELVKQQEGEIQFLRDAEAKHQQQMLDANLEEIKLRAMVRYNRAKRQELRTALTAYVADAETMAIDNFVKTSNYENAMGDICCDFYKFGFDLTRLQAERAIGKDGKVELLDALDMKGTSGLAIPEEIPFPEQWLPKRTSTERPPLELLLKWEAQAGDDIDAPAPSSSEPHADCVVCQKMHGPPPCEGPAQS